SRLARDAEGLVTTERSAAEAAQLAKLRVEAAAAGAPVPIDGMNVYRVYGRTEDLLDVRPGSGPWGASWTPVDPNTLPAPRAQLGLPDVNHGRFVIKARLGDAADVKLVRRALEYDGQPGGAPEYIIPEPETKLTPLEVHGVNPDW
ncbi:MAG: hypothetical protein LC713_01835, partial [Actinobacteria bacterium]|nr:hypothetical protein [Actinomycetota bacterium]